MRRLVLAVLITLLAPAARATQDGWPALFDVARVPRSDVLNLRAGPGAGHAVVGALARRARGVEVIRPSPDLRWGLVNAGEGTAWASLAFLDRRAGQWAGAVPGIAQCFGTEPFWRLARTADGWTFDLAGEAPVLAGHAVQTAAARGRRDRHLIVLGGEDAPGAVLVLRTEACGDGMSDRAYGLSVDMVFGPTAEAPMHWFGCCSLAAPGG